LVDSIIIKKMVHTDERPYVCDYEDCDKAYKARHQLKNHVNRFHKNKRPHACDICGKCYTLPIDVVKHKRFVHERPTPFACTWEGCLEKFHSESFLRRHMTLHTGKKPCVCTVEGCGADFRYPHQLKSHIELVHEKEAKYMCSLCTLFFKYHLDLVHHMKEEHTPESVTCEICGKKLKTKAILRRHNQNKHETNKKLTCCTVCGKSFSSIPAMKVHVKTVHEGSRPYGCSICDKFFGLKGGLSRHFKTVHKLDPKDYEVNTKFVEDNKIDITNEFTNQQEESKDNDKDDEEKVDDSIEEENSEELTKKRKKNQKKKKHRKKKKRKRKSDKSEKPHKKRRKNIEKIIGSAPLDETSIPSKLITPQEIVPQISHEEIVITQDIITQ